MSYGLANAQERGTLFVGPGVPVYEGMIIGVHKYDTDLDVNVCKARHKSGVRVNQSSITHIMLKEVTPLSLI